MANKPAIPTIPPDSAGRYNVLMALKQNVELLTGVTNGTIKPLAADAGIEDIVRKLNEVISRLNVK